MLSPLNYRLRDYFLLALLVLALVLVFLVFWPYVTTLLVALVMSVTFRPMHVFLAKILNKGNEKSTWLTFLSLFLIICIFLIPITFLVFRLSSEAQNIYYYLIDESNRSNMLQGANDFIAHVSNKLLGFQTEVSIESFNIARYANETLFWAFENIDTIFSSLFVLLFHLFILFVALYYMLRDGGSVKKSIIAFSPLLDNYDEAIFDRLEKAIRSVVHGSLAIAILQGILAGVGLWIFGVPNPVFWGSLAAIGSLIPAIGTSIILIPSVIYVFINGTPISAILLALWAFFMVGMVDNFLAPYLYNRGIKTHPFLVFLSVIGGLSFFGPIGFVLGPLTLSFLFSVLDIYRSTK